MAESVDGARHTQHVTSPRQAWREEVAWRYGKECHDGHGDSGNVSTAKRAPTGVAASSFAANVGRPAPQYTAEPFNA
jgi:hypothetical protein